MADIKEINGKFYDFSCSNKSFLQTAYELKTLHIRNFYFMLEVKDPKVVNIDPFKPNITRQEVEALMIELKSNMWFYARTVARIRSDKGIVPFNLHRGLASALWCFNNSLDWCLCCPRQTWKTSGTLATIVAWAFQLSSNLNVHFFGKESENTKRNLAALKDNIELLPEWLQFKRYEEAGSIKKTRQSTEILENRLLHNKLTIHPKPASRAHAQGMARGASAAMLYFDEIEHTPYFDELLSNSAPAFKTAADNARATGRPAIRAFTTTPGNLDTPEGMIAYPIIKSMIPWTEKIYDMTYDEINNYKSAFQEEYHADITQKHDREVVDIFYIEYQYYQIRKTYDWVLEQYKLSGDKMAIRREILLQRLRGSTESPISAEDIEYLISNMKKSDKDLIINGKWRFRLYEHGQKSIYNQPVDFDENIPYLVGVDPASGGGGDNIAITIVNPYNLKIAAEFKNPYIGGVELSKLLVTLINEHTPKGVVCIERNSMGIYLIQMICDQTSIKENLYWNENVKQLESLYEESEEDYQLRIIAEKYKKYGTYLTKKVRDAMFEILFKHIDESKDLLLTEYLVDDICKLIKTSTGKIMAIQGEHDDCILSYLHAMYIYYTGDNLPAFGIDRKYTLNTIEEDIENNIMEKDNMGSFFSTENITFESILVQDAIRTEEQIKYVVEVNPHVHDEVYSKHRLSNSLYDDNTNIKPYFFDMINSLDE